MKPFFPAIFTTLYGQSYVPGVDFEEAIGDVPIPNDTKETGVGKVASQTRAKSNRTPPGH
jgi:hypothetical protein